MNTNGDMVKHLTEARDFWQGLSGSQVIVDEIGMEGLHYLAVLAWAANRYTKMLERGETFVFSTDPPV